jgi:hypothetical protein
MWSNGQPFANYLYENIRIEKKPMKHPKDEDLERVEKK